MTEPLNPWRSKAAIPLSGKIGETANSRKWTRMEKEAPTDSSRLRYTAPSQGKPRIDSTCNPPGPPGKPGPGRPENIIRREVDWDQRKRGFHGWHG